MMNALDAAGKRDDARLSVTTGTACIAASIAREEAAGWHAHLAIEVEEAVLRDTYVFIEVRDNGSGIEPDVVGKIFDPFFTTKAEEKGTGLGLAICRNIAEESQGNILLSTKWEAGTSLRLFLPHGSKP